MKQFYTQRTIFLRCIKSLNNLITNSIGLSLATLIYRELSVAFAFAR